MLIRKLTATGVAQKPFASLRSYAGLSSPGEEESGEGEINTNFSYLSVFALGTASLETAPPLREKSVFHLRSSVAKNSVPSAAKEPFNLTQPSFTRLNQIEPPLRKKFMNLPQTPLHSHLRLGLRLLRRRYYCRQHKFARFNDLTIQPFNFLLFLSYRKPLIP
jgi:hypothetical protein